MCHLLKRLSRVMCRLAEQSGARTKSLWFVVMRGEHKASLVQKRSEIQRFWINVLPPKVCEAFQGRLS